MSVRAQHPSPPSVQTVFDVLDIPVEDRDRAGVCADCGSGYTARPYRVAMTRFSEGMSRSGGWMRKDRSLTDGRQPGAS